MFILNKYDCTWSSDSYATKMSKSGESHAAGGESRIYAKILFVRLVTQSRRHLQFAVSEVTGSIGTFSAPDRREIFTRYRGLENESNDGHLDLRMNTGFSFGVPSKCLRSDDSTRGTGKPLIALFANSGTKLKRVRIKSLSITSGVWRMSKNDTSASP